MTKVLVTGSSGMIGSELCEILESTDCQLFKADLKSGQDLSRYETCLEICSNMDEVYHLVGVKGSPRMTNSKPVDFMKPMLQCDTNMICAAQASGIKKFLYTSSIAVLNPQSDKYPSWAKQTGEILCEAMRVQYPDGTEYCIVRPANVYGRYDNFDNPNAMVITSLVKKALSSSTFEVWGDGSEERDFINAKDVARGMVLTLKEMPSECINLCSGSSNTIKEICSAIQQYSNSVPIYNPQKASGDKRRVMPTNAHLIGFKSSVAIEEGIKEILAYVRRL